MARITGQQHMRVHGRPDVVVRPPPTSALPPDNRVGSHDMRSGEWSYFDDISLGEDKHAIVTITCGSGSASQHWKRAARCKREIFQETVS